MNANMNFSDCIDADWAGTIPFMAKHYIDFQFDFCLNFLAFLRGGGGSETKEWVSPL